MPRELPIALVAIDNATHELTRMALEDTLWQITPQQILILSNAPRKISIPGAEHHYFDGGYIDAMRALWYDVPPLLEAPHFIWIQWDSWVLNGDLWDDQYLEYDYVGAPWPIVPGNTWYRMGYDRGRNVGNGGFSLRSRDLARFLSHSRDLCPLWLPEDDAICRKNRKVLEGEGFRWAPEELARKFSFECEAPPETGTFGFHRRSNFARVLSASRLAERERWLA